MIPPLTEPADIRCPENIKTAFWGIFKWEGYHHLEYTSITQWGAKSWHKYEIEAKCKLCGAHISRFGVDEVELVRAGLLKEYKCTDCGHVNLKRDNGEIRVGVCDNCDHPLWN